MAGDLDRLLADSTRRTVGFKCWWCRLPKDHPAQPYLTAVRQLDNPNSEAVSRILKAEFGVQAGGQAVRQWLLGERSCH